MGPWLCGWKTYCGGRFVPSQNIKYQVRLTVEVWRELWPGSLKRVTVELDQSFSPDQMNQVGTAIQAGSWEALKAAMKEISDET